MLTVDTIYEIGIRIFKSIRLEPLRLPLQFWLLPLLHLVANLMRVVHSWRSQRSGSRSRIARAELISADFLQACLYKLSTLWATSAHCVWGCDLYKPGKSWPLSTEDKKAMYFQKNNTNICTLFVSVVIFLGVLTWQRWQIAKLEHTPSQQFQQTHTLF